jgi:hypothetical protein
MIATTKTVSATRVRKHSSSIHRRIVHQRFWILFWARSNLGAAVPGLAPDTVAQQGKTVTEPELSRRLANEAGLSQFLQFRAALNAY